MSSTGVHSGGRYIVFESGTQGLVTATLIERLAGRGKLINLFDYPLEK